MKTHDAPGVSVCFDATGMQVVVCGEDGHVKIVDTETGNIHAGVNHPGGVTAVAWSFDRRQLAMGHLDGTVTDSEFATGAKVTSIPAHSDQILWLAWSPDGRRLATSGAEQFQALIWDLDTRQPVLDPLRHSHYVLSIAWSADGRKLATGSTDQTIKIWRTDNGQETVTFRGYLDSVISVAWGPEDRLLASSCEDGSVKIWTSLQDQESLLLPGTMRVSSVAWTPDGQRLASASDDGQVRIWEPARPDRVVSAQTHHSIGSFQQRLYGLVHKLSWSPDGAYLASAGMDGVVNVWNLAKSQNLVLSHAEAGSALCLAWSPDGKKLAVGFANGKVHIFTQVLAEAQHGPRSRVFQAHTRSAFALAWSPAGDRLASGSYSESVIRVWDPNHEAEVTTDSMTTTTLQAVMAMDNGVNVMGLAWSPDGKQLASSSSSYQVKTWDTATGREIHTMRGHHDFVSAVVWSPDGSRLASAGFDNSVRIWDTATGAEACAVQGHHGFFHDVSWNHDGARLAAASSDGNVWIWDATRGFERDVTPRALPYIDRAVAAGTARGDDLRWYAESYLRAGRLTEALSVAADDAATLVYLSKIARKAGQVEFGDKLTARAVTLLEQQRAREPLNASIVTDLADLLLDRRHRDWTVLEPVELKSTGGATLALLADGSILAGGSNPINDAYIISALAPPGRFAALLLEAIPDPSMPGGGVGRGGAGSVALSNVSLALLTAPGAPPSPIPFGDARSDIGSASQAANAIDADPETFWGVYPEYNLPHQLVLKLREPVEIPDRAQLVVGLAFLNPQYHNHGLGRFRLSISGDTSALERIQKQIATVKRVNPWAKLAVAYDVVGDQGALRRLLEEQPQAAAGMGDLKAAAKDWDQAIAFYNQAIRPETSDADLLSRRAKAYQATRQWDRAGADWLRVIDLRPDAGSELYLAAAPVFVLAGDEPSYVGFCSRMRKRFADSASLPDVERTIKASLLIPNAVDVSTLPSGGLIKALDDGTAQEWLATWLWSTRALLAYRSGDAESAVKYVAKSEELKPDRQAHMINLSVLALSQHQLGHTEKSRRAIEELSQHIAQEQASSQDLHHDTLIAEVLFQETKAKLRD